MRQGDIAWGSERWKDRVLETRLSPRQINHFVQGKCIFVPDNAYNENGAKISPHNSSPAFLRKHPSLRGRHAPLVWLRLEKACEHMSLKCLDKWKRAGEMAVKGRAEDITSVRGCQTESVSRPPAVFTGQKRRGTPTCATQASPKMREKDR